MAVCSFCNLSTDPAPFHQWATDCLPRLRRAVAERDARIACLEVEAGRAVKAAESALDERDEAVRSLETMTELRNHWRGRALAMEQQERTVEVGG